MQMYVHWNVPSWYNSDQTAAYKAGFWAALDCVPFDQNPHYDWSKNPNDNSLAWSTGHNDATDPDRDMLRAA